MACLVLLFRKRALFEKAPRLDKIVARLNGKGPLFLLEMNPCLFIERVPYSCLIEIRARA